MGGWPPAPSASARPAPGAGRARAGATNPRRPRPAPPLSCSRRVVAQPVEDGRPAVAVVLDVLDLLLIRPIDAVEAALHDAQPCLPRLREQGELDEESVVVAHDRTRGLHP